MNAKDYLSRYEILDGLCERIENAGDSLPECFGVEYLQEQLPHQFHHVFNIISNLYGVGCH